MALLTGVLTTWSPGKSTVETMFANNIASISFSIGLGIAVAIIGIGQIVANVRNKKKNAGFDRVVESKKHVTFQRR